MSSGPDVTARFVATMVDEWVRSGLTDVVVAPGSRSTPVLAALAADGRLRLHVVLDERAAGFVALGLGVATGRPAPVVTTSGTAAVELHPAVVEAHQAGVAMLAVTADRPPELHGVGAPQTVHQPGLYGVAVRAAFDPGVPDDAAVGAWRSLASRAVADTVAHPDGPGPVHLNLAFREPLLGDPGDLPPGRPGGRPWHEVTDSRPAPDDGLVDRLAAGAGGRGLIVAGGGSPPAPVVLAAAEALDWPVLADARSGCRVEHPLVVAAADALLRATGPQSWRPSTVLGLGAPWASKVLGQWLAALPATTTTVLVDPTGRWADPSRTAATVARCDPALLCQALTGPLRTGGAWSAQWRAAEASAQGAIDAHLAGLDGVTEAAVARTVVDAIPDGGTLVVASSMPVRDVEWYGAPRSGLAVVANRGANGIDGTLATAIGVALGRDAPTVCLSGDLAFVYDVGALLWADRRAIDLTVVVVDNDGGGIFGFLPQASALAPATFEAYWGTPHGLDLPALAEAYGATARTVTDLEDLRAELGRRAQGVRVLVVRTDRAANPGEHARLETAVAAALGRV